MEQSASARSYLAARSVWVWICVVCPFFVPADIIYSIVQAGLQSEAQREAAPRRTWLSLLCLAPGRHQASPSHFNYGWHCLRTRREKATHRFY